MSIRCSFGSAELAKKSGWFSRRHKTSDEHFASKSISESKKKKCRRRGRNTDPKRIPIKKVKI